MATKTDEEIKRELREWIMFPSSPLVDNVRFQPKNLAELTKHLSSAMMSQAIFD